MPKRTGLRGETWCFHTWPVVSDPGAFPPLARFVWAYVNAAITLGSAPKQLRSPERGGLGSIENELWSGLVVVRKQSDPTDQAISQCIMGNYVSSMKISR